jgi:hypothetical protein
MEKILNDSVMQLVSDGKISLEKMHKLIEFKNFVDRVSDRDYISAETTASLISRFGVAPDLITWGDYFQTDLAVSAVENDDAEFDAILDTVRFDIMAAWDICSSNGPEFFEWVDTAATELWLTGKDTAEYDDEEKELAHLKVLADYYTGMELNGNFYESEFIWYHAFFEAQKQVYTA